MQVHKTFCLPILAASLLLSVGCAPSALPMEMGQTFKAIAVSTTDQTLWENIVAHIDGSVINPGVVCWAAVKYEAGARLDGAQGGVDVSAQGEGTGAQSPEAQALIRDILSDRQAVEALMVALRNKLEEQPVEAEGEPEVIEPETDVGGESPPASQPSDVSVE